jgi:outer membrane protein OmpA-like peptidoglycan-associated protein
VALATPQPAAPATPAIRPAPLPDSGQAATVATRLAAGQAVTLRALYFLQGKADLLPAVQASLDTLAAALATRPTLHLEVQGHTDNQGDSALNRQLSQRRAEAVSQYLAAHGVAASRLRAVGYGGTRPIADNRQLAQRPRNRRVVLLPLAR